MSTAFGRKEKRYLVWTIVAVESVCLKIHFRLKLHINVKHRRMV